MIALLLGTPFFVVFGALSDKVGRKWIMMIGMLIALLTYRPIYSAMYEAGSVTHKTMIASSLHVDKTDGVSAEPGERVARIDSIVQYTDGSARTISTKTTTGINGKQESVSNIVVTLGTRSFWTLVLLVFVQVIYVTMVYGPIAAFLVEMFPTRIRYTSMSLPYHIGNGIFGGLLPAIATFLATKAQQANDTALNAGLSVPYEKPFLEGLWYPIILAAVSFVIGVVYINGKDNRIDD
jgi:MFS family permease